MENSRKWGLMWLGALLCLALMFQGARGIWQPDEGYYVGTAVTMQEKQSLTIPYLGESEVFLDKPPLVYWGVLAGLRLFGQNEFAVRFVHGFSFAATALLVGLLAGSMFRGRRTAFLASLIYATMAIPFFAANFVTPDTLLALWTTAAAYCFWQSVRPQARREVFWKMALCAAVGMAFLAKGPAALIPCGGMFVYLLLRRRVLQYFLNAWSLVGLAIFCTIGLSWYAWIFLQVPGAAEYIFDSQVWGRLVSARYDRNPGLIGALIYVPVIALGSLPWSIVWLEDRMGLRAGVHRKRWWLALYRDPRNLYLTCLFIVPLGVLCLASSKLGLYALPLFAPIAIGTARLWTRKLRTEDAGSNPLKSRRVVLTASWCVLLVLSKLAVAHYPTADDMRRLSSEIAVYLGPDVYEVGTVDERADGLLFYGISQVEHLTSDDRMYPSFTVPEHILVEVEEFFAEGEKGVFLFGDLRKANQVRGMLEEVGIACRQIRLGHERVVLVPREFSQVEAKRLTGRFASPGLP